MPRNDKRDSYTGPEGHFWYFEIKNIFTGILTAGFLYWICLKFGVDDFIAKATGCLIVNLYFIRASAILDVVKLFFKSRRKE